MVDRGPRWVEVGEAAATRESIADVVRGLASDATHLMRTEVRLAKAEVRANVAGLVTPIILVAAGLILGIAALFTLMAAFVGLLVEVLDISPGLASLIVAAVVGGIAGFLVMSGLGKLRAATLAPTRTMASVKEDVQTVKGNR